MPSTPARKLRDSNEVELKREQGRQANEEKYGEFKRGCDEHQPAACTSLGEWWALMRHDFSKAVQYYTPACIDDKYSQACLNLGLILTNGSGGIPINIPKAITVFGIGCEQGNADACAEGSRLLLREALQLSSSSTTTTSSSPSTTASSTTSTSIDDNSISSTPPQLSSTSIAQIQLAQHYLYRGCHDGEGVAHARCCSMLGSLYTSKRFRPYITLPDNKQNIITCLERGCRGEQSSACMRLASIYRHGSNELNIIPNLTLANNLEKQSLIWMGMTEKQAEQTIQKRRGNNTSTIEK